MSYTNQSVTWQAHTAQNIYGDIKSGSSVQIKARKQPHMSIVRTAEGKEYMSKHIYYVDPTLEPYATIIDNMDKLDGELVVQKYVMMNISNKPRMVRFITV